MATIVRWIALALLAAAAGAMSYWFYSQGRTEDIVCVLFMAGLTSLFYAGDQRVDEVFEQDTIKAEYERRDWELNS